MPQDDWAELPGRLIVVSGPSGSGKSTLVRRLLERPGVRAQRSVSATTRPPRPGERPGRDYEFLTRAAFDDQRDGFLEWAEVHDHLYGTPEAPIRAALAEGICVLLVIDVQGAMLVRQRVPNALLVFIHAPGAEQLEARLRGRGTDDEASIARRLANARAELARADQYDVQLINDDLDRAVEELAAFLSQNRCGG